MAFIGFILALPLLAMTLFCFLLTFLILPLWMKLVGGFFILLFAWGFLDEIRKRSAK